MERKIKFRTVKSGFRLVKRNTTLICSCLLSLYLLQHGLWLRACWQWCANECSNSQQCWQLQCIVGRIQPISLCKPCVLRVRCPNNVGKVLQTDPTLLRYASAIREQKKCWELLAEKFDRFQTLRNNTQQHPTTCNRVCKRTQHLTSNNVTCCRCYPTPDELEPPVTETDRPYPDIDEPRITSDGVQKLLENLNPNKSMVPDQIHPRVLKQL